MEGIYKHYIIDMSCNNNFVQVPTVQGDGNNVRGFEVELIANNVQYVVDASNVHVCIAGTKPDTKQILNDCSITEEGYILIDITQQMSAVAGRGDYCIMLIDNNTNSLLTSFPFYILTTASAYNASEIISSNEFKTLVNGIMTVDKLENDVNQLNEYINSAELTRINAENTRISNENIRINNENARENAESERITSENLRVVAEQDRITAEIQRITNEETRINNELNRINAESLRVDYETIRENEEIIRQENEKNRIANEIIRQNQENTRQTNITIAISNAEAATLNANNSANEASAQAIYAKAQGDYAKEQGDYANEQGGLANLASDNATSVANDLILKRDSGYFKGEKGDPGKDAVVTTISGMFAFNIDSVGHLIMTYASVDEQPNFSINSEGHLIYTFA